MYILPKQKQLQRAIILLGSNTDSRLFYRSQNFILFFKKLSQTLHVHCDTIKYKLLGEYVKTF